jgi:hypothetical protein
VEQLASKFRADSEKEIVATTQGRFAHRGTVLPHRRRFPGQKQLHASIHFQDVKRFFRTATQREVSVNSDPNNGFSLFWQ